MEYERGMSEPREVHAPRGTELSCKGWVQEAAFRMLQNNLDPEVAERPRDLVVYGGTGKAARSWEAFDVLLRELRDDRGYLVHGVKAQLSRRVIEEPRTLTTFPGLWHTLISPNVLQRETPRSVNLAISDLVQVVP